MYLNRLVKEVLKFCGLHPGEVQNLRGHGPEQPAVVDPALSRGSSNINDSVKLEKVIGNCLYHLCLVFYTVKA